MNISTKFASFWATVSKNIIIVRVFIVFGYSFILPLKFSIGQKARSFQVDSYFLGLIYVCGYKKNYSPLCLILTDILVFSEFFGYSLNLSKKKLKRLKNKFFSGGFIFTDLTYTYVNKNKTAAIYDLFWIFLKGTKNWNKVLKMALLVNLQHELLQTFKY